MPPVPFDEGTPLCLKVVIDCSGSMSGTSIAQARKGALAILDQLRPQDYVNITCFGNRHEHLFETLMPCDGLVIKSARARMARLEADMGGTETRAALKSAYRVSGRAGRRFEKWIAEVCPEVRPAVLLITDGEIWGGDDVIAEAVQSGHRVFTVGVGMAVAEGFIGELARATGGACELVSPQEGMAELILVQFHRLRQPGIQPIELAWDVAPLWQTALPETLFAGDTVNVFAGFGSRGPARLSYRGGAEVRSAQCRLNCPTFPAWPRKPASAPPSTKRRSSPWRSGTSC
ncbi:MAG: VWA domain-containing protein [Rhodoferax sp.]|nr:VWA domain-containing protein [Rhodoferax sp.]